MTDFDTNSYFCSSVANKSRDRYDDHQGAPREHRLTFLNSTGAARVMQIFVKTLTVIPGV